MFQVTFSQSILTAPTTTNPNFCGKKKRASSPSQAALSRVQPNTDVYGAIQSGQPHIVKNVLRQSGDSQETKKVLVQAARANTKRNQASLYADIDNGLVESVKKRISKLFPQLSHQEAQRKVRKARENRNANRKRRNNPFINPPFAITQQKKKARLAKGQALDEKAAQAFGTKHPNRFKDALAQFDINRHFSWNGDLQGERSEFLYELASEHPEIAPSVYSDLAKHYLVKNQHTHALDVFKEVLHSSTEVTHFEDKHPGYPEERRKKQQSLYAAGKSILQQLPPSLIEPYGNGGLLGISTEADKIPFLQQLQKDVDEHLKSPALRPKL